MASTRRTMLRAIKRNEGKYFEIKYAGNRKERRAKKHKKSSDK